MDNIQKSERVISVILAALMERGIQGGELSFSDLGLDDSYAPFFSPCVRWLVDEGLIRVTELVVLHDDMENAQLFNPVLTSYGFSAMGARFSIEERSISVGEAVKEVAQGNASFSRLGDFLGGLLGGFTKSMGSS